MKKRSKTESALIEALSNVDGFSLDGRGRYVCLLAGSDNVFDRITRVWRDRYPEARNRPAYKNVVRALAVLLQEGVIEERIATAPTLNGEKMYRLNKKGNGDEQ